MSWNDGLDERRTSSEDTVLEMNVTCTAFVSCNSACILQGLPLRVVLARSMTILMKETAFNGMRDFHILQIYSIPVSASTFQSIQARRARQHMLPNIHSVKSTDACDIEGKVSRIQQFGH